MSADAGPGHLLATWHTYPTHVPLRDGSHVPVVLMFHPQARTLVGARIARTGDAVSAWVRDPVRLRGTPDAVVHIDSPTFPDLTDVITNGLAGSDFRHSTEPHPDADHLVWVLGEGMRVSAEILAHRPATDDDIASTLHRMVSGLSERTGEPWPTRPAQRLITQR